MESNPPNHDAAEGAPTGGPVLASIAHEDTDNIHYYYGQIFDSLRAENNQLRVSLGTCHRVLKDHGIQIIDSTANNGPVRYAVSDPPHEDHAMAGASHNPPIHNTGSYPPQLDSSGSTADEQHAAQPEGPAVRTYRPILPASTPSAAHQPQVPIPLQDFNPPSGKASSGRKGTRSKRLAPAAPRPQPRPAPILHPDEPLPCSEPLGYSRKQTSMKMMRSKTKLHRRTGRPSRPWIFTYSFPGTEEFAIYYLECPGVRCPAFTRHPLIEHSGAKHLRACGCEFVDEAEMMRKYAVQVFKDATSNKEFTYDACRSWNEEVMEANQDWGVAWQNFTPWQPVAAPDPAMDTAPDAAPDAALVAAPDVTIDTAPDPSLVADINTALDAAPDAAPDATMDTALDPSLVAAPDASPDAALVLALIADLNAALDAAPVGTPDAAPVIALIAGLNAALDASPGYAPDPALVAALNGGLDTTSDAGPVPSPDAAPFPTSASAPPTPGPSGTTRDN